MSEIVFYNMGFGDSFLIQNGKSALLVDCGTYYDPQNITMLSTFFISNQLKSNIQKDLMITHYHEDHFNKILDIVNSGIVFDTIYVRNLGKKYFSFDFYSMFVELTKYVKRTGDYKTYVAWLSSSILSKLIRKGGTVVGLNSDTFFNFNTGNLKAKVLWPDSNIPSDISDKLESMVKRIESILSETLSSSVFEHIQEVKTFFEKIYNCFDKENESDPLGEPSDEFEELYNESIDSVTLTEEEAAQMVNDVEPLLDNIKGELLDLENYLSLVFEMDGDLLMCGDATKKAMKSALLNSSLANSKKYNYKIVKVPHHGTKPYFFNSYCNSSTHLLIPNSFQIRSASWGIYSKYSYPNNSSCHCLNNSPTSACKSICHSLGYTTLFYKKIVF